MKRKIKKSFTQITRAYIILMRENKSIKSGSNAEWLLDNYYIFSQENASLKNLRLATRAQKHAFSRMFSWAKFFLEKEEYKLRIEVLLAAISETQKSASFSVMELSYLPAALSAVLLEKAAFLAKDTAAADCMGNIVKSLVTLRELDIKKLFEQHCALDIVFSRDKTFAEMTFDSKKIYRRAAAKLASRAKTTDAAVAEKALSLTKNKKGLTGEVGYYLVGDGENELRRTLGLKEKKKLHHTFFYLSSIFFLTFALLFWIYIFTRRFTWVLLSTLPILDISVQTIQFLLMKTTPVRPLPRLALTEGIPKPILVVYPTLLSSVKKAEEMVEKLEICFLANRDNNLKFAVLGDFRDSQKPNEDAAIPASCSKAIARLNAKYGERFFLLCREQIYSQKQKKWMGEERKRGALHDLNLFLRGKYTFRYTAGNVSSLEGIQYVLTLDDDTLLPPSSAQNLAGAALHPLNMPQIKNGRVNSGYGIIQPRVSLRLESANRTFFSRIFAGQGGIDTYQSPISEFYMDVFGESIFTGKGLYHVDTFLSCISFPKDTVLSHDLLEGCFVRCGFASDVQVFDSCPARLTEFSGRQHRWMRGDWQIFPWLFNTVRNEKGQKVPNHISVLSKWKIFDNMRRSLTPVFNLLLLSVGGIFPALLAFVSLGLPLVFCIIDSILRKSFFHVGEKRTANIIYGVRSSIYQTTLTIVFLAHNALTALSAAFLGCIRSVTHRDTLQWVTAADAEAGQKKTLYAAYVYMLPSVLYGLLVILACLSGTLPTGGLQLFFACIWISAPTLAYISGMEGEPDSYTLSAKNNTILRDTAERIWHFFRDYMTEEDNFLPPDNVQIKPYKGVAHRTSPTNIGLGILACLCACDLGFITKEEMESRIEKTMNTVEKLPTWHGHLYNWYDTKTLKPMLPRYISTVDSGNFAAYLLTAAMGLKEYAGGETPLYTRLLHFVENTDFRPLFHKKKKLFSIGFSLDENKLTDSYYDLLISEARQAGFLAIALGQISPAHWFALGRGLVESDGYKGLVSWSGTMFEYFMPLLIMRKYENSMLAETYRFALLCQKKYGKRRRVPWGVSESGFYAFDNEENYQYKAFGVPELGLARQDSDDVVITPYATILALMEDPKAAILNMQLLRKEGLFGEYGFFEAADYSPHRITGNMRRGVVKSYMSHHQGMSLAAITNLLCKNAMQRRFHAHPAIKATEPLLKERVPVCASVIKDRHARPSPVRFKWQTSARSVRSFEQENTFPSPMHLLSNGSYHVHIDTKGRGRSMLDGVHFNTFSPYFGGGQNIWIVNTVTGEIFDGYGKKIIFTENKAEFKTESPSLSASLTVSVLPDDTCEKRRISIVNQSGKSRVYEIYFYTEPSLSLPAAEWAHPAFSKLFITTKEENGVLLAKRKKRTEKEKTFVGFAAAMPEGNVEGTIQFDTDRLSFYGRDGSLPVSLSPGSILARKTGTILDPCFAFKVRLSVLPGMSGSVTFLTGLAESEEKAKQIVYKYQNHSEVSATNPTDTDIVFKDGEEEAFLHAASFMVYGGAGILQIEKAKRKNVLPKQELWKFGISGDLPILTVRLTELADETLLDEAIKAVTYWKTHGILTDLVIFCDEPGGYTRPVYQMAEKRRKNGIYILGRRDLNEADYDLLLSASAIYLDKASGGFSNLPAFSPLPTAKMPLKGQQDGNLPSVSLCFNNGTGGFDAANGEYVIQIKKAGETPLPWVHVVANELFGFVAGESGGGYTWYENSHAFRLSPWSNDPVRDPLSELLVLSEENDIWSPMAGAFPEEGNFRIRYGAGYAVYERNTRNLMHEVTMFTPPKGAKKHVMVTLENLADKKRELLVQYAFAPVLGTLPHPDDIVVLETGSCVRVRNALSRAENEVYLSASGNCKCGKKLDKVFANLSVTLDRGERKTMCFTLGVGQIEETDIAAALSDTKNYWNTILTKVQVKTEDMATNLMLNRYLLYQALACRLFARTAFYQSGGAFGFRDQLQDVLALMDAAPHLVRRQILLHAAHQFEEGDAFHWWHTDEKGVRTRFSDDRLFLPYVTCLYAEETGDNSIWDAEESFVIEPVLGNEEEERYTFVKERSKPYSIYEHCTRAIDISLEKGVHSLPLMGGGDWNDGMNTVGIGGMGESVWLAWFLKTILDKFVPVAEKRGDTERATRYKKEALLLLEAVETEAWDGTHYARAFFDNGTALGTSACAECSIDAISQSWAVIAGGARPHRLKVAMESVYKILVDKAHGLLRLLTPAFENSNPSPGYIQSYPKGLRENGGQYTHGAIWAIMAFAILGEKEKAWELFRMLNPILHTETPAEVSLYKTEPYVMSADIYTAQGHEGRGGWSWYTGAAAWMYRVGIRYILGFQKKGNTVSFSPSIPLSENGFTLSYKHGSATYIFHVHGKSGEIQLVDDGQTHEIVIQ